MKKIRCLLMFSLMMLVLTGCSATLGSLDKYFGNAVSSGFDSDIKAAQKLENFLVFDTEKTETLKGLWNIPKGVGTKKERIDEIINAAKGKYNTIMSRSLTEIIDDNGDNKNGFNIASKESIKNAFETYVKDILVDKGNEYIASWNSALYNYVNAKTDEDKASAEAVLDSLDDDTLTLFKCKDAYNNDTPYNVLMTLAIKEYDIYIMKGSSKENMNHQGNSCEFDPDEDAVVDMDEILWKFTGSDDPSYNADNIISGSLSPSDFRIDITMKDDESIFKLDKGKGALNKELYTHVEYNDMQDIMRKVCKGDVYVLKTKQSLDLSTTLTADKLGTNFKASGAYVHILNDNNQEVNTDDLFAKHSVDLILKVSSATGDTKEFNFGKFTFEGLDVDKVGRLTGYAGEAPSFTYANSKWYLIRYPVLRLDTITAGETKGMTLKTAEMPGTYITIPIPYGDAPGTVYTNIKDKTQQQGKYELNELGKSYLYGKGSFIWSTNKKLQEKYPLKTFIPTQYQEYFSDIWTEVTTGAFLVDYLEGTYIYDNKGNAVYPANTQINSSNAEPVVALGRKIRLDKAVLDGDWTGLTTSSVAGHIMDTMSKGNEPAVIGDNVTFGNLISVTKGNGGTSTSASTGTGTSTQTTGSVTLDDQGQTVQVSGWTYIGYAHQMVPYGDTKNSNPHSSFFRVLNNGTNYGPHVVTLEMKSTDQSHTEWYYKVAGHGYKIPYTMSTSTLSAEEFKRLNDSNYMNQLIHVGKKFYRVFTTVSTKTSQVEYIEFDTSTNMSPQDGYKYFNIKSKEVDFETDPAFASLTIEDAVGISDYHIAYAQHQLTVKFKASDSSNVKFTIKNHSTDNLNRIFNCIYVELNNWKQTGPTSGKYDEDTSDIQFCPNTEQRILKTSEIQYRQTLLLAGQTPVDPPTGTGAVDTSVDVGQAKKLRDKDHKNKSTGTMGGVANIPVKYIKTIKVGALRYDGSVGTWFAGNEPMGQMTTRAPLYILGRDFDFMDSNYQSGWIQNTSTASPNGNLSMWIAFLKAYGYTNYPIANLDSMSLAELQASLSGILKRVYNFGQEEDADSTIILDPRVIQVVQDEIDEKNTATEAKIIRASAKIIGFLLAFYGFFLLLAYLIDSGTSGEGDGLLYKVTFHKMKAATGMSKKEAVELSTAGYKYVTLGALGLRVFLLMSLGVTLLIVDPIQVVSVIVGWVDGVVTTIKSSIFNSK